MDSGGLTAHDRTAAQSALDELQNSNISLQLVTITRWVQSVPAACRIRLVSRNPNTYKVYVFWIPYLAAEPYVWLNMKVTNDPRTSTFHLGTSEPVLLPGGRLSANGRSVNPLSVDTTLLSRYGAQQARKSQETLRSPWRRRLREARREVPAAHERKPQAPSELLDGPAHARSDIVAMLGRPYICTELLPGAG